jgi:Pyruvate/2-oxoacid:ferredoxin oxidoreductase delta subunit
MKSQNKNKMACINCSFYCSEKNIPQQILRKAFLNFEPVLP